jgi:hypothetical protein
MQNRDPKFVVGILILIAVSAILGALILPRVFPGFF